MSWLQFLAMCFCKFLICSIHKVDAWTIDSETYLDSRSWPGSSWLSAGRYDRTVAAVRIAPYHTLGNTTQKTHEREERVSERRRRSKGSPTSTRYGRLNTNFISNQIIITREPSLVGSVINDNHGRGMGGSVAESSQASGIQRFATEPAPQTAVLGTSVVLPCRLAVIFLCNYCIKIDDHN